MKHPATSPPRNGRTVILWLKEAGPFTGFWSMDARIYRLKDVRDVWMPVPGKYPVEYWEDLPGRKGK